MTVHTRASTDAGPDYCKECSAAAQDWVKWPCSAKPSYCITCAGMGRITCAGPIKFGLTVSQMKAAGLREIVDFCYGMHMGHPCPDCTEVAS